MARIKKADAPPLTQERLRELFRYDPITGVFWRNVRPSLVGRCDMTKPPGWIDDVGYHTIMVDNVRYRAHRLAWLYVYGKWPDEEIDHINGVRHDNRLENLRDATRKENARNIKLPKHNTSGYKGVFEDRDGWAATIKVDQKIIHLGWFRCAEHANIAYRTAAKLLHKEFWRPS